METRPNPNLVNLAWVDGQLEKPLSVEALRTIKDLLLRAVTAQPRQQLPYSLRIARVNLKLSELAQREDSSRRESWPRNFVVAAKRLLDPDAFAMLSREADLRTAEERPVALPAPVAIEPPHPPPSAATPPPARPNLTARVHELVSVASNRPMRFDPTTLFREFGREKVLALWNMLPAERRPDTAAAFRAILRKGEE